MYPNDNVSFKIHCKFFRPPKYIYVNSIIISIYKVFMCISTLYPSRCCTCLTLQDVAQCHVCGFQLVLLRRSIMLLTYEHLCMFQSVCPCMVVVFCTVQNLPCCME
jgi:hypothetical protein